jgi:hypothetical protein
MGSVDLTAYQCLCDSLLDRIAIWAATKTRGNSCSWSTIDEIIDGTDLRTTVTRRRNLESSGAFRAGGLYS